MGRKVHLLSNRLPWVCVLIGVQGWSGVHDSKKTLAAYILYMCIHYFSRHRTFDAIIIITPLLTP